MTDSHEGAFKVTALLMHRCEKIKHRSNNKTRECPTYQDKGPMHIWSDPHWFSADVYWISAETPEGQSRTYPSPLRMKARNEDSSKGTQPPPTPTTTYPGKPAASMTLARVTSLDHTSYCHLRRPRTPQSTLPVCSPTRMFRSTSVASATDLEHRYRGHRAEGCRAATPMGRHGCTTRPRALENMLRASGV